MDPVSTTTLISFPFSFFYVLYLYLISFLLVLFLKHARSQTSEGTGKRSNVQSSRSRPKTAGMWNATEFSKTIKSVHQCYLSNSTCMIAANMFLTHYLDVMSPKGMDI